MAYQCENCEDLEDGSPEVTVIVSCRFKKEEDSVVPISVETEDWCGGCEDDSFYCALTEERYSLSSFEYAEDEDGDTVCGEAAAALGWKYDEENEIWRRPENYDDGSEEETPTKKEQKAMYVDFYWELRDGDRHGVLQLDGGGEEKMLPDLEKAIYKRIDAAGADRGDPAVVNTYTRLELIDRKLLSPDYVL